jgi:hypothetical protein
VKDLRAQPWWTDADRTELDALAYELVRVVFEHRESCAVCAASYSPCPRVGDAIAVILDWRERRMRISRARWERSRKALTDFEQDLDDLLCASEHAA